MEVIKILGRGRRGYSAVQRDRIMGGVWRCWAYSMADSQNLRAQRRRISEVDRGLIRGVGGDDEERRWHKLILVQTIGSQAEYVEAGRASEIVAGRSEYDRMKLCVREWKGHAAAALPDLASRRQQHAEFQPFPLQRSRITGPTLPLGLGQHGSDIAQQPRSLLLTSSHSES